MPISILYDHITKNCIKNIQLENLFNTLVIFVVIKQLIGNNVKGDRSHPALFQPQNHI